MEVIIGGKRLLLLFVLVSRFHSSSAQNCSSNLTNTVVYEGSSASFSRVSNDQPVQWQVIPCSDFFNSIKSITNYDDVVAPRFSAIYAVSRSKLRILNSTIAPQGKLAHSTAGLYIIKYRNTKCEYGANLIVIRSGPVCSYDASNPSKVKLLCSVDFGEPNVQPNNPVFTWKDGISVVKQQRPIPSQVSTHLKRSTSQFVIDGDDDAKRYECQLTFGPAPQSPLNYVTSTAPNFTASCFVSLATFGPTAGGTANITTGISSTYKPLPKVDATRQFRIRFLTEVPAQIVVLVITAMVGFFAAVFIIISVISALIRRYQNAKKHVL